MIALEPEAAAIFCQEKNLSDFYSESGTRSVDGMLYKLYGHRHWRCVCCYFVSPHLKECKTLFDSVFHTLGSGFQLLVGSAFLELYSGFQKRRFPGFRNPLDG